MTIVVGIPCSNGIVLAADQQISAPGWHKYHEPKIRIVDGFSDYVVALAYSGLPALAKEAHEKIINSLSEIEESNLSDSALKSSQIRNCAGTVLTGMAQQHFGQLDLSMLIASSSGSGYPDLWLFNDSGFHGVFGEFAVLGVGDSSLIRYLQQMHSIHDSVETGESLGVFFVEKAKQNIEGCGGKTDVVSIRNGAQWRQLTEVEIQEKAAVMDEREKGALRSILLR